MLPYFCFYTEKFYEHLFKKYQYKYIYVLQVVL